VYRENIQAKKQIGTKFRLQVAIGRGNQASIRSERARTSQPFELSLLQDAEQLGLQFEGNLSDFIQKMVPPFATSKRPMRCAMAPVKAPLSCPNISLSSKPVGIAAQLTFTNAFPQRGLKS
jgi:hypothetical protein